MVTGARRLLEVLASHDVEVVFGLPGVHNLAVWEALRGSGIRLVGVRHEQTAVYAADGLARVTGRLGVAVVTTGPGAANAAGALGEAWASRSPVLLIATDIPTALRRPGVYRGALHETPDQGALFAPITAERHRVADAASLPDVMAAATAAPHSRRGPCYLEIPTDLLGARTGTPVTPPAPPTPPVPLLRDAAALLD